MTIPPPSANSRIPEARRVARQRFRGLLHRFLVSQVPTVVPSWARALGVSSQQILRWADQMQEGSPLALGDVLALKPEHTAALLRFLLEDVERSLSPKPPLKNPAFEAMQTMVHAGHLAESVQRAMAPSSDRGRHISHAEWIEIIRTMQRLQEILRDSVRGAQAAAEIALAEEGGAR